MEGSTGGGVWPTDFWKLRLGFVDWHPRGLQFSPGVTEPHITPGQRDAITASGGLPVHVDDPETNKVYLLVEAPLALDHDYVRSELAKGIAAVEAGKVVAWDPEQIKQEGRRRLASRDAANG